MAHCCHFPPQMPAAADVNRLCCSTPRPAHLLRTRAHRRIQCHSSSPLDRSHALAKARLAEAAHPTPLLQDPLAAALCARLSSSATASTSEVQQKQQHSPSIEQTLDILATKFIDDTLDVAMASTSTNSINKGDFQQVVILGDGLDTRPFRTLWPKGTMFFMVASAEAHETANAVLKEQQAKPPPGCLLRRVSADLSKAQADGDPVFLPQLERAGFQGSNLSVWAVQGLEGYDLQPTAVHALLSEVASAAAYHSLLVGELSGMTRKEAEHMLADVGLLSSVRPHGTEDTGYGRISPEEIRSIAHPLNSRQPAQSGSNHIEGSSSQGSRAQGSSLESTTADSSPGRWLFTSQQVRLSFAQIDTYQTHLAAAEALDEDFEGNFS